MASSALRAGKYASMAATAQGALSELSEPLIPNKQSRTTESLSSSDSEGSTDDFEDEDERTSGSRFSVKDFAFTSATALLAAGGLAASATAMVAAPVAIVFVMGGICILNSPMMALKQLHISKDVGIRQSINNIRKESKLLKEEINFLHESVSDLQSETSVLKELERDLQKIAAKQRVSSDAIVEMVNANEAVLSGMKSHLKEMFVQSMIKVVMRSDKDGSMKINEKEVHLLSLRIQIQLEPYDIKLDTDMFEAMVIENNDISNVLKFCSELLFNEDESDDEDDDSITSEDTMGFEAFCHSLSDPVETPLTFEEKVGMITINDKFSGGSVEVARGGRMTVVPSKCPKRIQRKTMMNQVKKRQTVLAARARG